MDIPEYPVTLDRPFSYFKSSNQLGIQGDRV